MTVYDNKEWNVNSVQRLLFISSCLFVFQCLVLTALSFFVFLVGWVIISFLAGWVVSLGRKVSSYRGCSL